LTDYELPKISLNVEYKISCWIRNRQDSHFAPFISQDCQSCIYMPELAHKICSLGS